MNEAETRAEHIDPALKAAGWGVVEGSRVRREFPITLGRLEGHGRRGKPLTADYVLEYRNTKLAVIEAKAWGEEVSEGVAQAKNYAGMLAVRFTYSTNGRGIYGIDMRTGQETPGVPRYPTPDELWQATFAQPNAWRDRFAAVAFEDKGGSHPSRYYQETAVERVLEAIAGGKSRVLLTLATGTGKTFIAFQIAWKLFHARWNLSREPGRLPRILFLADRNILANQAYNAFSAFEDRNPGSCVRIRPDEVRKTGKPPKNGSLFFTIFQTFLSGAPKGDGTPSPYFGDYPRDFFDFIVIDECHRGGANDESTWRDILEYFSPSVQLGLTATPKRDQNIDTYRYFGEPVYIYSLKQGINDGFLTPFKVKQYTTTLDAYTYTPDDTVLEGQPEVGKRYVEEDFNRVIVIDARERHRVELFMAQIAPHEKVIVFCANQAHALAIRDCINQLKKSSDPNYCHRVSADDGELGEQFLRDFQDNEKTSPLVLTTSHKLSTGVDARNVRHIVLLRPIRSMIEFKQIVGRGTRLFDGKDYFTIHDFVKAHQHFNDPEWDGEPVDPEPKGGGGHGPGPGPTPPPPPPPPPTKIRIQLAPGKELTIQHMMQTTFWSPDGKPISAEEFLRRLYGNLPDFFRDEAELRRLWGDPATRQQLLHGLAEKGYGRDTLAEVQRAIDLEQSDLFDVLALLAFQLKPVSREQRAEGAKIELSTHFNSKQRVFLDFVLRQYVQLGVDELSPEKLRPLLRLKYKNSIADAMAELGQPEQIGQLFADFQKYLYRDDVA
ncbi:MAG: DEAD/DEAH box helicase family protein [Candidatus Didemnitutus sp.]|nr:DEAD/DEAH box helicase family protein [Candidatus Didemnitutus sp.]